MASLSATMTSNVESDWSNANKVKIVLQLVNSSAQRSPRPASSGRSSHTAVAASMNAETRSADFSPSHTIFNSIDFMAQSRNTWRGRACNYYAESGGGAEVGGRASTA
eukprot:4997183-Pyramimonas_sp.AAC.2